METLLKLKETDEIPTDKIIDAIAPTYFSKAMHQTMKDFVKTHLDLKAIMKSETSSWAPRYI
jgi:hypothetical protein